MKKLILILPLILAMFFSNGQNSKKDKRRARNITNQTEPQFRNTVQQVAEGDEDDAPSKIASIVDHRGIYDAKVSEAYHQVKIGDDLYFSPASTEAYQEGQVVVGFGIGFVRSDYVAFQKTGAPAAQLITGESVEDENAAMNFIVYDPNVVGDLTSLYEKGEPIYLYGISISAKEASTLRNQEDSLGVIGGEGVPTFVLIGFSTELIEKPGVILIYSNLIRDADDVVKEYQGGVAFEAKVQMIGKKELEERTFVPPSLIDWLYRQGLLVTRWVNPITSKKSSRTNTEGIKLQDGGGIASFRRGSR